MEYYNQLILEGIIRRRMIREAEDPPELEPSVSIQNRVNSYPGYNPGGDTGLVVGGIAGLSPDPGVKSSYSGLDQGYYQGRPRYSKADYMRAYAAYLEDLKRRRMGR
jgi:hypothetical protein